MSSISDQLRTLKVLTKQTDILHAGQRLQLRNWGAIVFSGRWSVFVSIENKIITYELEAGASTVDNTYLIVLDASIKELLGDEWTLSVNMGNVKVY